jgi:hypothetical protein
MLVHYLLTALLMVFLEPWPGRAECPRGYKVGTHMENPRYCSKHLPVILPGEFIRSKRWDDKVGKPKDLGEFPQRKGRGHDSLNMEYCQEEW